VAAWSVVAAHKMKREVVLLVAFTVGGCLPDQGTAKNMTACQVGADRFYQGYNTFDVNNPRSQYIIACMAAKGYDFDISSADCNSRRPLTTQRTCYVSSNWLARIIDKMRVHEN
jgi:hypothetical protein